MFYFIKKVPKSLYLLISIFAFVFVFPIFDETKFAQILDTTSFSIMLLSIFSIIDNKTNYLRYLVISSILLIILMYFMEHEFVRFAAFTSSSIIFAIATGVMIHQIIVSKTVTPKVIVETISGYLLIGVVLVFLNSMMMWVNPDALSLPRESGTEDLSNIIYYSFITVTTIGYGDVLPVSQLAKSLSILFGIIGQLYLTIIIALIIGKYLSSNSPKN